jgi:hypothetical protein
MLCALLVHQSTVFPEPLTRLSRWLDRDVEPIDEVLAAYEAADPGGVTFGHAGAILDKRTAVGGSADPHLLRGGG